MKGSPVRNLRAYSARESFDEASDELTTAQGLSEDSIFNFNNWVASSPPLYQPHTGFHRFWHEGRLFWFSMDKERVPGGFMGMMVRTEERIVLTTIGRSTERIKDEVPLLGTKWQCGLRDLWAQWYLMTNKKE
jgi:chaperone BCS1